MLKAKPKTPRISLTKFDETPEQFGRRVRSGGARKPLRSLKELAEEFGVKWQSLHATMHHDPSSPSPRYSTGHHEVKNTWFDPDAVRKWWKERKEKQT
jgi:hypothetical protein